MRVLNFITGLGLGGAENMLCKLSVEFVKNDHIVHVVSLSGEGHFSEKMRKNNIRVTNVNLKKLSILEIRKIFYIIREYKPSIIQSWMYHGNLFSIFIKYFFNFKAPLIWNVRQSLDNYEKDGFFTKITIKLGAFFSKYTDGVIYNSQYSMKQHEVFGYDKSKSIYIPNGFDINNMQILANEGEITRAKFKINDTDIVIINNGRYHITKNQECFIEAANKLCDKINNVKFFMLGEKVDFKNKKLNNLIRPEYRDRFFLLGKVDNVYPYLRLSDIYTSTSIAEAFSNSIGEAMFMALPCVVTNAGDSAQIVGDESLVIPKKDKELLLKKWVYLCGLTREQRIELGEKLKQKAISEYSISTIFNQYLALYKGLLK